MSNASRSSSKLLIFALALAAVAVVGKPMSAQPGPTVVVGNHQITALPDDWSYHHLVFSNPGTEEDAIKSGHYQQWLKITSEPRYVMQQLKRGSPAQGPAAEDAAWAEKWAAENRKFMRHEQAPATAPGLLHLRRPNPNSTLNKDWNEQLSTSAAPSATAFPAKWSNDVSTADCNNDFVVYPVGQLGSGTHASIIAYNNLYSGCSSGIPPSTFPTVDWAYNTGGTVALSPVFNPFSPNPGIAWEMAFIQTSASDAASLVLLRFPQPGTTGQGTLTTPTTPATASSASNFYTGTNCATPCMYKIALSGTTTPNDTLSNPYYDVATDSLYVGDSTGKLHKFTPVFYGAPAEVTGGTPTWPVQMNHGTTDAHQLTSPVYDSASGNVFVGSSTAAGGYFYAVSSSSTSATINAYSAQLDATNGLMDAPLVDSTAGEAYVFVGRDTSTSHYSAVYQFATSGSGWGTLHEAHFAAGGSTAGAYEFAGTFDNTYFTSTSPTTPTGYLYGCSTASPSILYQVYINANVLSTVKTGPTLTATAGGHCSTVSEFYNSYVGATGATGSVTINTDPATWTSGSVTVTIGSVTYTFVTGAATAPNQVLIVNTGFGAPFNELIAAADLYLAVEGDPAGCVVYTNCVYSGQTANPSATATTEFNPVDLASTSLGTTGDFTLSTNTPADITVSAVTPGSNGSAEDLLFLSVYEGNSSPSFGCTAGTGNGCVMAFQLPTTPSSFGTGTTPLGTMNLSSPAGAASTGGIVIDNDSLENIGGTSQIYFVTQHPSTTTPCVSGGADGVCAIQASQTAP